MEVETGIDHQEFMIPLENPYMGSVSIPYTTAHGYSILIVADKQEIEKFVKSYKQDNHF